MVLLNDPDAEANSDLQIRRRMIEFQKQHKQVESKAPIEGTTAKEAAKYDTITQDLGTVNTRLEALGAVGALPRQEGRGGLD